MKRQNKYLVLKRKEVEKYLSHHELDAFIDAVRTITDLRKIDGKGEKKYVVVAEDWPMYEQTWKAIEDWVDSKDLYKRRNKMPHPTVAQIARELNDATARTAMAKGSRDKAQESYEKAIDTYEEYQREERDLRVYYMSIRDDEQIHFC